MSIPIKPLTDMELVRYAKQLQIPNFRGVYMKDQLPDEILKNESMIINLDNSTGGGTHWVCFSKKDQLINYFDSFGVLLPIELIKYFNKCGKPIVMYNVDEKQKFGTVICGHLCLHFLINPIINEL